MFRSLNIIVMAFAVAQAAILPLEKLPVRTDGNKIVDADGEQVRLACVNWYGAHMQRYVVDGLDEVNINVLAQNITNLGFNCVRLVYSLEMYYSNPVVNTSAISANPQLFGMTAMEVFDATIKALTDANQMIILNNHISDAGWCCSPNDGNGLWHNPNYPTQMWMDCWTNFTERYQDNKYVIGSDLRNELRHDAVHGGRANWGFGGDNDWHKAATDAGNAILAVNPDQLIIVEGLMYAFMLEQIRWLPITLDVANRVVYSFHIYDHSPVEWKVTNRWTYALFLDHTVTFMLNEGHEYTAPIWLGEFGTGSDNKFWSLTMHYLKKNPLVHWAYWPYNGYNNSPDHNESYGILNPDFMTIRHDWLIKDLQSIQEIPSEAELKEFFEQE